MRYRLLGEKIKKHIFNKEKLITHLSIMVDTMLTPENARKVIENASPLATSKINEFSREVLITRGGRIGSGMGLLLEALWGYYVNQILAKERNNPVHCELAWLYGHEYNDFACINRNSQWDPEKRTGELLRIEIKSMVASADESKAHFDQLVNELTRNDLLVVIVWDWKPIDEQRVSPIILDMFVGLAYPIALLRDILHIQRGGSFVDSNNCPDKCNPFNCSHSGEPLNEQGKRERLSGPDSRRVSSKVSYASNFGGLVRMLKTNSPDSRKAFRSARKNDESMHKYISFIHRNFPNEEINQYTIEEWRYIAKKIGIDTQKKSKIELSQAIRTSYPEYQDILRTIN